ncbi:MAG: iron(II)-dependent oxidoreductase [Planctomycetota bacterium]|jgi:iron(II)-dependent oxidoreductase
MRLSPPITLLSLLLIPTSCSPEPETQNQDSGAGEAVSAEAAAENDTPGGSSASEAPPHPSLLEEESSPDPSAPLLPESLRGRFAVVGDISDRHGDHSVPRSIEHISTGLLFLYVPGGSFTFGSGADDPDRFDDERPTRRVQITGFYISANETTLDAWQKGGGESGSAPAESHPVNGMTWYEARDWCAANGLALPSEAQWEYAASGTRDNLFPWGYDTRVKGRANLAGVNDVDLWPESSPVGSFGEGASWCGAVDMVGNLMEWCRDGWTPNHLQITEDQVDPVLEPDGDAPEFQRLVRGGSYESDSLRHLRCAYRNAIAPTLAGGNLGFRAVVTSF